MPKEAFLGLSSTILSLRLVALSLAAIVAIIFVYHQVFFREWNSLPFALADVDAFEIAEPLYCVTHPFARNSWAQKGSLIGRWVDREEQFSCSPVVPSLKKISRLNGIVSRVYGEQSFQMAERYLQVAYEFDSVNMFSEEEGWLEKSLSTYENLGALDECIWVSSWLCQTQALGNLKHPKLQKSLELTEKYYASLPPGRNSLFAAETIASTYRLIGDLESEQHWRLNESKTIDVNVRSGKNLRMEGSCSNSN